MKIDKKNLPIFLFELLIVIRLGGQFLVQILNLQLTGDLNGYTIYYKVYQFLLVSLIGITSLFAIKSKLYRTVNSWGWAFFAMQVLYVCVIYYDLYECHYTIYKGLEAARLFRTVITNVILLDVSLLIFNNYNVSHVRIVKLIIIINFLAGLLYLTTFDIALGSNYDGFLLQDSGFSSLAIGYIYGFNFIIALSSFNSWSKSRYVNLVVTLIFTLFFAYMILLCGKTGPTIFTLAILPFVVKNVFFPKMKLVFLFLGILFLALIFWLNIDSFIDLIKTFNPNLGQKLYNTFYLHDTSGRDGLYRLALMEIEKQPFWGSYFTLRKVALYPHNLFLESMITWGVFGTVYFIILIVKAILNFLLIYTKDTTKSWLGYLFLFSFLSAQTTGSIYGNYRLWFAFSVLMLYEGRTKKVL